MTHPAGSLDSPRLVAKPAATIWRLDFILTAMAIFLSPVNYLRLDIVYFTLSDMFSAMALLAMLATNRLPIRPFGAATQTWYVCLLMLIGGIFLGSALRGGLASGAVVCGQYLFSLMIVPMLILQRSRAEVLCLVKVFVAGMITVMLHGILVVQYNPEDTRFVTLSGRLATLVERENAAGALAALAIIFSLWLHFTRNLAFVPLLVALPVLGYGLLLTGSNTGFFLTCLGLLILVVLSGSLRIISAMVVLLIAFVIIILTWGELFLPEIFLKRVFGALSTGSMDQAGTFSDRMFLIREAFDVTHNTIFVGLGADQYRLMSAHGAPVHNTYLLLLAEGGIVSLIGHIGLIMTTVAIGWVKLVSRSERWHGVLTLTTIVMLALVMNGIAHFYARFWAVPWSLALAASLCTSPNSYVSK